MPIPYPFGQTHTLRDGRTARVIHTADLQPGQLHLGTDNGGVWEDFVGGRPMEDDFNATDAFEQGYRYAIVIDGNPPPTIDPNKADVW